MSVLVNKQHTFSENFCKLLGRIKEMGLQCSLGECYRPPEMAKIYAERGAGILNSVHCQRLAIDIFLWKDGEIIMDGPEYGCLALYWLGLNPDNRWGGKFKGRKDVYHYSMQHEGVA